MVVTKLLLYAGRQCAAGRVCILVVDYGVDDELSRLWMIIPFVSAAGSSSHWQFINSQRPIMDSLYRLTVVWTFGGLWGFHGRWLKLSGSSATADSGGWRGNPPRDESLTEYSIGCFRTVWLDSKTNEWYNCKVCGSGCWGATLNEQRLLIMWNYHGTVTEV